MVCGLGVLGVELDFADVAVCAVVYVVDVVVCVVDI